MMSSEKLNKKDKLKTGTKSVLTMMGFLSGLLFILSTLFKSVTLNDKSLEPEIPITSTIIVSSYFSPLLYGEKPHNILSNFLPDLPTRGSTILIKSQYTDYDSNDFELKKLLAFPGDTIAIINSRLFVNKVPSLIKIHIVDDFSFPQGIPDNKIIFNKTEWNMDNIGNIVVPKKGRVFQIDNYDSNFVIKFIKKDSDGRIKNYSNTYIVKKDYIFVVGLNNPESNDSRNLGFVPKEALVGKAFAVIEKNVNFLNLFNLKAIKN